MELDGRVDAWPMEATTERGSACDVAWLAGCRAAVAGHDEGVGVCECCRACAARCLAIESWWCAMFHVKHHRVVVGMRPRSTAHRDCPSTWRRHSQGRCRGHGRGCPSCPVGSHPSTQPQCSGVLSMGSPVLSRRMSRSCRVSVPRCRVVSHRVAALSVVSPPATVAPGELRTDERETVERL